MSRGLQEVLHGAWLQVSGFWDRLWWCLWSWITEDAQTRSLRHLQSQNTEVSCPPQPLGFAVDVDLGLVRSQARKQSVAGGDLKGHQPPTPGHDCTGAICVGDCLDGRQHEPGEEEQINPELFSHPNHEVGVMGGYLMKLSQFLRAAGVLFVSGEAARAGCGILGVSAPSGKHQLPRCGRCCIDSGLVTGQPVALM